MSLTHLHRHSEFSLLDGCGTAQQYAERAAALGHDALALTDHGTLAGSIHHIQACEAVGIKPICGMEAYFRPDRHARGEDAKKAWHLILLAKNATGWANLVRMSSEAHRSGFYYKPCVDWQLLEKYREGVFASTACISGYLPSLIRAGNMAYARAYLRHMRKLFGDDFAIEIMPNSMPEQMETNANLFALADQYGVPVIATCDAHFPYSDWIDTQDVLLMVSTGQSEARRKAKRERGEDVYAMGEPTLFLMTENQMRNAFCTHPLSPKQIDEAIRNTEWVASRCEPITMSKTTKLPKVPGSAEEIIRAWCHEGLRRIGRSHDPVYHERMRYEIDTMRNLGVLDYFVIIGDMVRWARSESIRMGIGRGSAAGSLVSYLVGITGIDPIAHGLMFERFMNPDRRVLPDVDIDFQHNRRDEVKQYLAHKWGEDHVQEVGAYGRFGAKSALIDVSRVHDVPYAEVQLMSKVLDKYEADEALEDIYVMESEVRAYVDKYPKVWRHAVRLQGQVRALSKHPAGVVVTDRPVTDYVPVVRRDAEGTLVTAWAESKDVRISDYGLVKIDALATDSLSIQEHILDLVEQRTGFRPNLDELPIMADPDAGEADVLKLFADGMTLGIFQFESRGITGLLRQMKPTRFPDLSAANALYRPGPLQGGVAFDYGRIKNGEKAQEPWPGMGDVFDETYGLMVFQEQVMAMAMRVAGFTAARADDLRKAVGKKDKALLDSMEREFVDGCRNMGLITADEAREAWRKTVTFARYGFNKSHSASYAAQAYQDAWLKCHHPIEFYTGVMTYETEKVPSLIREAMGRGINILPPDINVSAKGFTIDGDAIRFGLASVKGVGNVAAQEILSHQPFTSLDDFRARVPKRKANQAVVQALIEAGAFDCFGARDEVECGVRAIWERQRLGFTLTVEDELTRYGDVIRAHTETPAEIDAAPSGAQVRLAGEVVNVRHITTKKKGDRMAFVDIANGPDVWGVTMFPRQWAQWEGIMAEGSIVLVCGEKDADRNTVVCSYAQTAQDFLASLEQYAVAA